MAVAGMPLPLCRCDVHQSIGMELSLIKGAHAEWGSLPGPAGLCQCHQAAHEFSGPAQIALNEAYEVLIPGSLIRNVTPAHA